MTEDKIYGLIRKSKRQEIKVQAVAFIIFSCLLGIVAFFYKPDTDNPFSPLPYGILGLITMAIFLYMVFSLCKMAYMRIRIKHAQTQDGTILRFNLLPIPTRNLKSSYEVRTGKGDVISIFTKEEYHIAAEGTPVHFVKIGKRYYFDTWYPYRKGTKITGKIKNRKERAL